MTTLQLAAQRQSDIYTIDPIDSHFDSLNAAKRELHLHLTEITRLDLHRNKQRFLNRETIMVIFWQCWHSLIILQQ